MELPYKGTLCVCHRNAPEGTWSWMPYYMKRIFQMCVHVFTGRYIPTKNWEKESISTVNFRVNVLGGHRCVQSGMCKRMSIGVEVRVFLGALETASLTGWTFTKLAKSSLSIQGLAHHPCLPCSCDGGLQAHAIYMAFSLCSEDLNQVLLDRLSLLSRSIFLFHVWACGACPPFLSRFFQCLIAAMRKDTNFARFHQRRLYQVRPMEELARPSMFYLCKLQK